MTWLWFRSGIVAISLTGIGAMFLPMPWSFLLWVVVVLIWMVGGDPDFFNDVRMLKNDRRPDA